MARYLYVILFVIVLALPFALRAVIQGPPEATTSAGDERLVIVTPHNQDIRREFARAFDLWHRTTYGTGVQIDYRTPGGTNDIVRLIQTLYDGQRRADGSLPPGGQIKGVDIDLVWGGGDFMFNNELKPLGVLEGIPLSQAVLDSAFPQKRLGGIRLYDQSYDASGKLLPPKWVGVCLSSFGIIYNPRMYQVLSLAPPKTWSDLADPRLAGWVALADPTHSGSVAVAYMMVLQRAMANAEGKFLGDHPGLRDISPTKLHARGDYQRAIDRGWHTGMGTLLLMAANARYFTDSATMPPMDVANGDAAAGVAIDFYANTYEQVMGRDRARYVAPAAATAITPDPIAILYGVHGRRLTLATHFIEFLLSREGQRLWILKPGTPGGPVERGLLRSPIRRDIYENQTGWADDFNPFTSSGGFNQRGEWMALFSDVRSIWAAAWIDSRDALKEAYATILAVNDTERRQDLIAALADLPIERSDVRRLQEERHKRQNSPEYSEWAARQRIDWAKKFRAHYAATAADARR
jgi:ABC-type Fe3+ transport system substrate-binding protein